MSRRQTIFTAATVALMAACGAPMNSDVAERTGGSDTPPVSMDGAVPTATPSAGPSASSTEVPVGPEGTASWQQCASYPCVTFCGEPVAIAPVESPFGFSNAGSIPWGIRSASPIDADHVLTLTMQEAEVRSSSDFTVVGRIPVPGQAFRSAVSDGWALAQTESGLALLDVSSPSDPRVQSWWFDAGDGFPYLSLVGAVDKYFVMMTRRGASIFEVSNGVPRELSCLLLLATPAWTSVELYGDVLAIAWEDAATLFRVSTDGPGQLATLPNNDELPFIGSGTRVALASNNRTSLTLYDTSGVELTQVAVADDLPQNSNQDQAIGGFAIRGDNGEVAFDLLGELEAYDVEPVAGSECLWRVTSRVNDEAFIISPVSPEQRFPVEPIPNVECPALNSYHEAYTGALSPDGQTLLFESGIESSWVFRDLSTGEERSFEDTYLSDWVY